MEGIISNIQRFSIHDGPGMRSTVFFKGCPLRCVWCHNPETYTFGCELRYNIAKCIGCRECTGACVSRSLSAGETGLVYNRDTCAFCRSCANACPGGALAVSGLRMDIDGVMSDVLEDAAMYRRTGGGVTLSGGEPTAQPAFCEELLDTLAGMDIHTCLDTCGLCDTGTFLRIADKAGLILFDLKHTDPVKHEQITGSGNSLILENLEALDAAGAEVEIRVPVIPGLNDGEENLANTARIASRLSGVRSIVLLGYHTLGQSKIYDFDKHGADIDVNVPNQAALAYIAERMAEKSGKPVTYR